MNRWLAARTKAYEVRRDIEAKIGRELYGQELIDAIIADEKNLNCLECPADDPLLGNKDEGYDQARYYASGFILISRDLPDEDTKTFYKAHELGHRYMHTRYSKCRRGDIDPTKLVLTLPYAEGRIATYNPRQTHESEATVFASELLVPSARLTERFAGGLNASELAITFQVPRYVVLSQMTTVLLAPPIDFGELCTIASTPPLHWGDLDDIQKVACCEPGGPVLVQAGPGTGKTQTLASRVEWLITERDIGPERILALTFSNRAAEELRLRLREIVPQSAHQVSIYTFHGFGLELLRRYSELASLPASVQVVDPVEAELLLEENLADFDLVHFSDPAIPNRFLRDILSEIARAKEELISPGDYMDLVEKMSEGAATEEDRVRVEKCREVGNIYRGYSELLRASGLVDYGDLVMDPVRIFRDAQDQLGQLQKQYKHILVDEYQDINRANGELVRLIAGTEGIGLWAVGDLRQSIYRFRGASPSYIRQFGDRYPEANVHPLQINYRASEQLVRFAKRVATQINLPLPDPKWMSSVGELSDSALQIAIADDKESELSGIGDSIQQFVKTGIAYEDIAVLCRTNSQASEIAQAFGRLGIPTLHLGKFFFRREVKDLLAVLSLVVDGHGATWPRVATLIRNPISMTEAMALWHHARENDTLFPSALKLIEGGDVKLGQSQRTDIEQLLTTLRPHSMKKNPNPWSILAEFLFQFGYYLRKLRLPGASNEAQSLLAIGQLLNLARAFGQRAPIGSEKNTTKAFIQHVRRLIERDDGDVDLPVSDVDIDAVRVLTVHKSKGLEFPVVFVPNLASRRFPAMGWRGSVPRVDGLEHDPEPGGDALDEERCLFVAMTRAKKQLILSRAKSYHSQRGKPVRRGPSELWRILEQPTIDLSSEIIRKEWVTPLDVGQFTALEGDVVSSLFSETDTQLELRAVKLFRRCPRQFYYRYILGLAVPDEREIYLRFHVLIHHVANWIQRSLANGDVLAWEAIAAKVNDEFKQQIPIEHVHAQWYRQESEVRMWNLWVRLQEIDRKAKVVTHREPVTVDVKGVMLQFRLDEVLDFEDRRVVTHYKTGQLSKSHQKDPLVALYRKAASEVTALPVQIQLNYLATGETVNVDGAQDRKVMAQLAEDVGRIQNGHFPPDPSYGRFWAICSRCSYLFDCPKGEALYPS